MIDENTFRGTCLKAMTAVWCAALLCAALLCAALLCAACSQPEPPTMENVSPDIQTVVERFFHAINQRDEAAYLESFLPQAEGLDNHRKMLKNLISQYSDFSYQITQSAIEEAQENRATIRTEVKMTLTRGNRTDLYAQEIVFYLVKYKKEWKIAQYRQGVPRKVLE